MSEKHIANIEQQTDALLTPFRAAIPDVEAALEACKGLTIAEHVDGEGAGYAAVKALRLRLKSLRIPLEKARKSAKAPLVALGRLIDEEHQRVEDMIRPEESRLQREEDAYLERLAETKRKKERRAYDRMVEATNLGALAAEVDPEVLRDGDAEAWGKELDRVRGVVAHRRLGEERYQKILDAGVPAARARINPPESLARLDEEMFARLLAGLESDLSAEREAEERRRQEREELIRRQEEEIAELRRQAPLPTRPEPAMADLPAYEESSRDELRCAVAELRELAYRFAAMRAPTEALRSVLADSAESMLLQCSVITELLDGGMDTSIF